MDTRETPQTMYESEIMRKALNRREKQTIEIVPSPRRVRRPLPHTLGLVAVALPLLRESGCAPLLFLPLFSCSEKCSARYVGSVRKVEWAMSGKTQNLENV